MKRFGNVLYVMVDGLDGMATLKQVLLLAEKYQFDLTLLDVTESLPISARMLITAMPPNDLKRWVLDKKIAQLDALVSMIESPSCKLRASAAIGNRADEIVREALEGDFDLVIKSVEKGSTDRRLLRKCKCPVWVLETDDFTGSGQLIPSNSPFTDSRETNQTNRINIHEAW